MYPGALLRARFLCYKPDMRKWMRERLTRRKKTDPPASGEAAPPPLQPAYFDTESPENSPAESTAKAVEGGTETSAEVEAKPQPARRARASAADRPAPVAREEQPALEAQPSGEGQLSEVTPARSPAADARGRGRRRGRGGRGRGGRGREQGAAPVADKAVAEGQPEEASHSGTAKPRAAAVAAVPNGVVVLAIGLPGSGKSSWFKRHNVVPLSSDMLRSLLFDDPREQRFQDLVFSNLRSMLKARLVARRPMNYVDATNLTPAERSNWIKLAKDYGYEVHAVFFDVPLEVCIERHHRRDRVVPEDVMRRMAAKLKPPAFEEGFAKIVVVRVKKKDAEAE
jgi:predicted kinase